MDKLQEIIKEIQELYNTQEKDYVLFCMDRAELECEDEEQAKDLLKDVSADWDWENIAREQWHLAWINDWLNIVKRYLEKMSSQD